MKKAARHLTTQSVDFWLLGGASIVLWTAMFLLEDGGRDSWAIDHHFRNLLALSGSLALVGNYPHFMASYRLAYSQGTPFVLKNWLQLIVVPVTLVIALAVSYLHFKTPAPGGALPGLNTALNAIGLQTQMGLAPSMGQELMSLLIQFMFFTVGWHYAKQTYGCMRVMAHFDGYTLSKGQWLLIKAGLFSVWFCSFAWANTGSPERAMHGISYVTFGLPSWVNTIALVAFLYLLLAAILMFRAIRIETGKLPSVNMLVAPVAFILWWLPPFVQIEFYLWIVPFFHSVQYLGFIYKIERERVIDYRPEQGSFSGGLIGLGLILVGFAAFELVPNSLDHMLGTQENLGVWFFFAAAVLFINVHHYFIDNVIWRFHNPRIRKYLLG